VRRWLGVAGLTGALAVAAAMAGCSSAANARTDENYCATVNRKLAELNGPSIATSADVTRTVELYRSIAKVAPLAVEQEWDVLTLAYETASTVVPGDQTSMQKAADTIRASQKSATAVAQYTQRLCNATIGAPIVATTLLSGTTTTGPDAPSTTAGPSTSVPVGTTVVGATTSAVPPTSTAP
jgi:hypothetical protein